MAHDKSRMRLYIGAELAGAAPPIIEKRLSIYHFYHLLPPNILICPPNIFDKSTPLMRHNLRRQLIVLLPLPHPCLPFSVLSFPFQPSSTIKIHHPATTMTSVLSAN